MTLGDGFSRRKQIESELTSIKRRLRLYVYKSMNVMVMQNQINVYLPYVVPGERHGIFVGNCRSLQVSGNYIAVKRFPVYSKLAVDGIRVFGYYGKRISIKDNHIVNSTGGLIRLHILNADEYPKPLWLVSSNVANVIENTDNKVKQNHNFA